MASMISMLHLPEVIHSDWRINLLDDYDKQPFSLLVEKKGWNYFLSLTLSVSRQTIKSVMPKRCIGKKRKFEVLHNKHLVMFFFMNVLKGKIHDKVIRDKNSY